MIHVVGPKIVAVETMPDETTCGKRVFVDENGDRWVETMRGKANAGTGDCIATVKGGRIHL